MVSSVNTSCRRLPVLLYHHVGPRRPGTNPSLTVSPRLFASHIHWLATHGYIGITPSAWHAWRVGVASLPTKPVLLTFDDGYADLVDHAFPVLRERGFSASVFIVTKQIGKTNLWDEQRGWGRHEIITADAMRRWHSQGIEFGSHSRTHQDLTRLSACELEDEVTGSAQDLETILGKRVTAFAYPYGLYDRTVEKTVGDVFELAFTVRQGVNGLRTPRCKLRRTNVPPGETLLSLACRVRYGCNPFREIHRRVRRLCRSAGMPFPLLE